MKQSKKMNLESIENLLNERRLILEEGLRNLIYEKTSDDQVQDLADQALCAAGENLKSSFENNEHEEYKMIIKALEAIKEGDYGSCNDCDNEISDKRLLLYPNATRCIACQEIFEDKNSKLSSIGFF